MKDLDRSGTLHHKKNNLLKTNLMELIIMIKIKNQIQEMHKSTQINILNQE